MERLTLTWDVLKSGNSSCESPFSVRLTLTWDVLKSITTANTISSGIRLTLTWDVLKCFLSCVFSVRRQD